MPGLYRDISIDWGEIATSQDMNEIQRMIAMAFAQEIIDNEGVAFVLDNEEDAFLMTPAVNNTLIDQQNQNGASWKSIENVYLRQTINLQKSSIYKCYVYLRNSSNEAISSTFEIREPSLTDDEGAILGTITLQVPIDAAGSLYAIPFSIDHLPAGDYYFVAKRTNKPGIEIKYDTSGSYNHSLAESIDDYEYDEFGADLWFKIEYGNSATFDIQGAVAQLGGEKVHNLDTHATIMPGSSYGDRVDMVCLTRDGYIDVVSSDISRDPEDPDIPFGYLVLGRVYIPQNATDARKMKLNQDDSLGEYRLRSILERTRRLEKHLQYVIDYNTIERIKYTVLPCDIDEYKDDVSTFNIQCDDGYYVLADTETVKHIWTLLDDSYIDVAKSATVDQDHTVGTAKLILKTITTSHTTTGTAAKTTWLGGVDRDTSQLAKPIMGGDQIDVWGGGNGANFACFYPGLYFYCWNEGPLTYGQLDIEFYRNVDYVYYILFKVSSGKSIDNDRPELVEISQPYQIAGNPKWRQNYTHYMGNNIQYQEGDSSPAPDGVFSGTKWITKGMYLMLLAMVPLNKSKPAQCWTNTWLGAGYPPEGARYANYTVYSGWYPMKTIIADPPNAKRLGIIENKRNNFVISGTLISDIPAVEGKTVTTKSYEYQSPGVLQSSAIHTDYGIATATIDVNLTLPENTYYTLEVSNDGGNKFFAVQGRKHTFTSQTGQDFIWKLTLYSNDKTKTPIVYYDANKGFAIKVVLGLTGGNITDGCLVTEPFDGNQIIKDVLKLTTNQFSHWQWARIWATGPRNQSEVDEEGRSIFVDIEASDDGTHWTKKVSSLYLDDFYHGSIDYSNYVGSYDEDEYNYNLDVDFDTETNTVIIYDGIAPFTAYDSDSITTSHTTIANKDVTKIAVSISVGSYGLLAFKNIANLDLSDEKQLHFWLACNKAMGEGNLELCLFKENLTAEANIPEPFEVHPLPQIEAGTTNLTQAVFKLTSPISDLRDFKAIGVRLARSEDPESQDDVLPFDLYVGPIEKISSDDFPLYERYLRLRVCMHRDLASLESPSVRKVGVVPIIT
jgi:hypothetical protein